MWKLKQFLKRILPSFVLGFWQKWRGPLQHHGLLLLLCPPLGKVVRYLPNSFLTLLMKCKILSYDFVANYAIPRKERIKVMRAYNDRCFFLNIGSGLTETRKDWRILEFCGDPIQRIGYRHHPELVDYDVDLMQKGTWPIPDGHADLVYSSHCLEHLTEEAGQVVFKEAFRVMKPGAIFRITLPDIDLALQAYSREDVDFFTFQRKVTEQPLEWYLLSYFSSAHLGPIDIGEVKKDFRDMDKVSFLEKYVYVNSHDHDYHTHINWFDFDKIKRFAVEAGFEDENVIRSAHKQSICAEMRTEIFDVTQPHWSLYVDIVK